MKKTLLLTIALLLSTVMFAQTFVEENFNSSELPNGWTTSEVGSTNWKISLTTYSGGDGNELKLAWDPKFEGTSRLITTAFDLSDVSEMVVSFKHFFDNFRDGEFTHTIGIATSSDNGATWNTGWSQEYTMTGVYDVKANFSTADMGKDNVLISLFYEGVSANMDNWFFDDLMIYKQSEYDLRIVDIDMPNMIETGEREISFSVENLGLASVESFEAKIKASNWESAITSTFEQNISNSEIVTVTCKDQTFNAIARSLPYLISVEILSINGNQDENASNNYIEKSVSVAFNNAQRIPMIEHFSSSTCGPCVAVNQQMHTLTSQNEGKYTYTKFPTSGDPYNNFEVTQRVQDYGVTGVPNIFLDGRSKGSNYLTQAMLDERLSTPAYADIRGAFSIEGDNIYVIADFMSYITLNNVVAYITVNEKTTTRNTGSNGETEFHHILMKMLKSKTGNPVSIKAGEYQRLEFTHNMSLTNVEEINDLEVALWLQNTETQEIYNSHFAYPYTSHCYPIQNLSLNENEDEKTLTWEAPEQGTPASYKVYINGQLVSENGTALSYNFSTAEEAFTAEVIAVYKDGKTSVGVAKLFGEADDYVTVEAPRNLAAAPTSTSSIRLTWSSAAYATSYNVYRDNAFVKNVTATNYTDEGLEYDTEYCYTVTSVLEDQESEHTEAVCVKTLGESLTELESSFLLFPNPANDRLFIVTEVEIEEVIVYDIYGRHQVTETPSHQDMTSVNVSNLNAGIYFIKINTNQGEVIKRFIKK
ncbi:MAG: T9SS type A sorting domain-containing protein [Bacteroidales bacterium]|nr:T9SS type A sorting domain-containing protein [Bacteroidales bacterium]